MERIIKFYFYPLLSYIIYLASPIKIIFDNSKFNFQFENVSNIIWVVYIVLIPLFYLIYRKKNQPFIGKIVLGIGVFMLSYLSWFGIRIATFCEEFIDEHKYKSKHVPSLYISTTYGDCGAIGSPSFGHKNYYNLRLINGINILLKVEQKTPDLNYFNKINQYE